MSHVATGPGDPLLWRAETSSRMPLEAPYPDDLAVTPLSVFGDHIWKFPQHWASINNRKRVVLNFLAPAKIGGTDNRLDPVSDRLLLLQLKDAMLAELYRRDVISAQNSRVRTLSATGAFSLLQKLRRIFGALKLCGCRSLSELTPAKLPELVERLGDSQAAFNDVSYCFPNLMALSRQNLVRDGLRALEFELTQVGTTPKDTTGALGWQPLSDDDVAALIRTSNQYIDLADVIASQLKAHADGELSAYELGAWATRTLPSGQFVAQQGVEEHIAGRIVRLVHAAGGNLIGFHLGLRAAEMLSLTKHFAESRGGEPVLSDQCISTAQMRFKTFKTERSMSGRNRAVGCHPRLIEVEKALRRINEALGTRSEFVFVPYGDELPYVTGAWNAALQAFCHFHRFDIDITSHRWRKSIAGIAVRVLTGAAMHLKELFGHESLAMTARYVLASPFIRDELRDLTLDEYRKRGRTLLESLAAAGGGGLGGRYGNDLEERFSRLVGDVDVTQQDLNATIDDWLSEMLRAGIYPTPVMDGVFCMKPATAQGFCATSSGDRLADVERCSAECQFQVQQTHRRSLILWTVRQISQKWQNWSPLEQLFWAAQCRDQMVAWPDLIEELKPQIEGWPALRQKMLELLDA